MELCPGASLRESRCRGCDAPRRSSDLMRVLLSEVGGREALSGLDIYEMQAQGPVHEALKQLPGYVCSEYLPDIPWGTCDENGVRSEDATALTFADSSLDIVISQDVMEHVAVSRYAFREINRVLRSGGKHIFTVPLHEGMSTRARASMEPVYHGDPLNDKGALVHWDFGDDLAELLCLLGMNARLAFSKKFYWPDQIGRVDNEEDYARYLGFVERGEKAKFFLYNSNVFVAEKF